MFRRSAASHEDPTSGFSFGKANPVQPLDLGIKAKAITSLAAHGESPPPDAATLSPKVIRVSPPREDLGENSKAPEDTQPAGDSVANLSSKIITVPFPMLHGSPAAKDHRLAPAPSPKSPDRTNIIVTTEEPDRSFQDEGDTLVQPEIVQHYAKEQQPPRTTALSVERNSVSRGFDSRPSKPHRRRRSTQASRVDRSKQPSEQDILQLMMFKSQKNKEEREYLLAAQAEQERKITYFQGLSEQLNAELQDVSKRLEIREDELKELQTLKPELQSKVKKFADYLKGLTNDHNNLRDSGQQIHAATRELREGHKEDLHDSEQAQVALNITHEAIKRERALCFKQTTLLQQIVQGLQAQLQHEQTILEDERARNQRLKESVGQASTNHDQLMGAFKNHHEEVGLRAQRPNKTRSDGILDHEKHSTAPREAHPNPITRSNTRSRTNDDNARKMS